MHVAKRSSTSTEVHGDDIPKKRSKGYSGELSRISAFSSSTTLINYGPSTSQSEVARTSGNEGKIAGCIEKVYMNFMCHSDLEVTLNSTINFILGRNGSGKSAVLAAVLGHSISERRVGSARMANPHSMQRLENKIKELEKKVLALKKLEEVRRQAVHFENEFFWALARDEEYVLANMKSNINKEKENIQLLQDRLEKQKQELEMHLNVLKETEAEIAGMDGKVKDMNLRLEKATREFKTRRTDYKNSLLKYKHILREKRKYKQDCNAVKHEIEKHRCVEGNMHKRKKLTQEIENCTLELVRYDSIIKSTGLEQEQLKAEAYELSGKVTSLQIDRRSRENDIIMKKQQLEKLKSETGNLSIYGEWMPRLIQRIEECYQQQKFVRKPLGPLGSLVKVKDAQWTSAIEKELGNSCQCFAVHCAKDSQVLQGLFKELGLSRNPGIFLNKFTDKLHNICGSCVRAPGYQNIFDVLCISDVNAANALIDANGIESILLIPTPNEAVGMMSKNVPKNCIKAITLEGDTFIPYPDYRMYARNGRMKARYLQIYKQDVIESRYLPLLPIVYFYLLCQRLCCNQ